MRAAVLACAMLALPASAATLRDRLVTLSDPSVRLSDLFAGLDQDRVIGPAPEPGGRIVVEQAQLVAIARQFSVDWRSASTADRVTIERPGRLFPRGQVLDALRAALLTAGMPPNAEIETPDVTLPMVPPDDSATPEVAQTSYDAASGRFTAMLSITATGMTPVHARLSGHVQEMIDVQVATRRIAAGEVLAAGDMQVQRLRAGRVRSEPARVPEDAVGLALRHPLSAGAPVLMAELGRPVMTQRGVPVQVQLDMPGLSVTVQGVAMEPGATGETVHVVNPQSRAVMEAQVTGPNRVRVTGGSPTTLPQGWAMPQPSPVRVAVR